MKNILSKLIVGIGIFSLLSSVAQAQPKIAIVDLQKVFDNYYKRVQVETNLKDEADELEKQRKEMLADFKKGEDDWKKLIDKSNDQAIAAEERTNSKKAAEKKLVELKDMEQTIRQFDSSSRTKINEKLRRKRDAILVEIRDLVNSKGKAGGYTLVIDSAARSINDTPVLLYNNGDNDLTESILNQLNASAPPLSKTDAKPKAEENK